MRVALIFGGRRIRIPNKAEESKLVGVIGLENTEALVEAFSGEVITVALEKRNLVFWLRSQRKSIADIANQLRISRRTIQYLLNGNRPRHPGFQERTG